MIKRFALSIIAIFALISGTIFGLAYKANDQLEQTVSRQFNEQQLVLARKIANDIQINFQFLTAALLNFTFDLGRLHNDNADIRETIPHLFSYLQEWGVLGIGVAHSSRKESLIYTPDGWKRLENLDINLSDLAFMTLSKHHPETGVLLGHTQQPRSGTFEGKWVMAMICPVQTFSASEQDTISVFILDAQGIARRFAQDVHSGKTGYAWVVDHKGYFMFHVEEDFDGQDSLTIRQSRNPHLSYDRINNLVLNHLLRGQEGVDWYSSGWHWDIIGEMRKLVAFSPLSLSPLSDLDEHFWGVAVAAPETEVYGLIQPIVLRQWLIGGLFVGLVMITFAAFLLISLRWGEALRREVDKKTEHLTRSERALRLERDKVKASMEQLVRTQEKLVLSERFAAIGEAAAHLSHEIKNPLMVMGGFASQILGTLPEEDQRREKLRIIASEAKRLEALLMEVRDFTRPAKPKMVKADANATVREVVDMLHEQFKPQDIRLSLELAPDLPPCRFDPNQLKQVLLNLTKNAMEAMPQGGTLTIESSADDNHIRLEVVDSGEGISKEQMKKLFHPFFTTKQKGTGLGLAVCYKIIQDHGGEITARSKKGSGSRFSVTLPLNAGTSDA